MQSYRCTEVKLSVDSPPMLAALPKLANELPDKREYRLKFLLDGDASVVVPLLPLVGVSRLVATVVSDLLPLLAVEREAVVSLPGFDVEVVCMLPRLFASGQVTGTFEKLNAFHTLCEVLHVECEGQFGYEEVPVESAKEIDLDDDERPSVQTFADDLLIYREKDDENYNLDCNRTRSQSVPPVSHAEGNCASQQTANHIHQGRKRSRSVTRETTQSKFVRHTPANSMPNIDNGKNGGVLHMCPACPKKFTSLTACNAHITSHQLVGIQNSESKKHDTRLARSQSVPRFVESAGTDFFAPHTLHHVTRSRRRHRSASCGPTKTDFASVSCPHCDRKFPDIGSRASHLRVAHPGKESPDMKRKHRCKHCGMLFYQAATLDCHMSTHEATGYQCHMCMQTYTRLRALLSHRYHCRQKMRKIDENGVDS